MSKFLCQILLENSTSLPRVAEVFEYESTVSLDRAEYIGKVANAYKSDIERRMQTDKTLKGQLEGRAWYIDCIEL